ncbi:hypothetical protein PUN28_012942 [Cardiocondyla obscurior]|uniref:Uncharacterized protein n=1 Tax=Cardiocondyla obscurior TaxID=286306 RepID=A0AAW2F5T5_9HYME
MPTCTVNSPVESIAGLVERCDGEIALRPSGRAEFVNKPSMLMRAPKKCFGKDHVAGRAHGASDLKLAASGITNAFTRHLHERRSTDSGNRHYESASFAPRPSSSSRSRFSRFDQGIKHPGTRLIRRLVKIFDIVHSADEVDRRSDGSKTENNLIGGYKNNIGT